SHKHIIEDEVKQEQTNYDKEIVTEVLPLDNFYLAEEIHQDYLEKNPDGYCHINLEVINDIKINPNKYQAKDKTEMKDQLTRKQFTVIMENKKETNYENKYKDTLDHDTNVEFT